MEKLKIKVVPDWREMGKILRLIIAISFTAFIGCLVFLSCADEWYIGKAREDLAREMFIVDSLIMDIKYQLDSTSIEFESFYIDSQRINNGSK
jgi:hypothetical protein